LRQKLLNEHQIQSQANQIILGGVERDSDKR
jgi:hypothetical protein